MPFNCVNQCPNIYKKQTPTRLFALGNFRNIASKEAADVFCSSHFFLWSGHSFPHKQAVRKLQHKHIISVQFRCRSFHLCEKKERKIIAWWSFLTVSTFVFAAITDLHSACCTGGALADVEEASVASPTLTTFTWSPTQVDDHGFPLEHTHQMGRFLALSDTYLQDDITVNCKSSRPIYFLEKKCFIKMESRDA